MANNYWKIGKMCEMWVKPKVTQQPGFPFTNKWGVRKVSSRGFQVKGNNFRSSCKHCAETKVALSTQDFNTFPRDYFVLQSY
jgi:hypothetical protein